MPEWLSQKILNSCLRHSNQQHTGSAYRNHQNPLPEPTTNSKCHKPTTPHRAIPGDRRSIKRTTQWANKSIDNRQRRRREFLRWRRSQRTRDIHARRVRFYPLQSPYVQKAMSLTITQGLNNFLRLYERHSRKSKTFPSQPSPPFTLPLLAAASNWRSRLLCGSSRAMSKSRSRKPDSRFSLAREERTASRLSLACSGRGI